MALVCNIKPKKSRKREGYSVHREVLCQYLQFKNDATGKHYIQLNTFGLRGQNVTQEMQFDEIAAAQLKTLIETTWPNLK